MTRRRLLAALGALFGLLGGASLAPARTWIVRVDHAGGAPTIQAGIDSAAVGDTVLVGPGTYRERVNFLGKDIVVVSEAGPEGTVLDGENRAGAVVVMKSGEGRGAVLEGFTVKRGSGEQTLGTTRRGGGCYILDSSPTLRGNVIEENRVSLYGGGLYVSGVSPGGVLIEGNVIRSNRAGVNGGGIALLTRGEIRDNVIEDNECETGDGGGLWIWTYEASPFLVESNRILRNRAGDHGGGILSSLAGAGGTCLIRGNVIAHNHAGGTSGIESVAGGGIALAGGTQNVVSNTIVFNDCPGTPSAWGGNLATAIEGDFVIELNIIAHALRGGGIYCYPGLASIIRDNLAWNNHGGDGVGNCVGWELADGNLVADPLLCDPGAGDFTVARLSPALSHPAGPVGAYPDPGCEEVPVQTTSWGRIKALHR